MVRKNLMASSQLVNASKFLSLVLRHKPETIGITLDAEGWADIVELLRKSSSHTPGLRLNRALLEEVVATSDKKRFTISEDGQRIRANQGHSVSVDLGLKPVEPPAELFHGTATRFEASIRAEGLIKQSRQHVHLSPDYETAVKVGQRHGKPVVLRINAKAMHEAGHEFFISENGVWLTDGVPPEYILP